MDVPIQLIPAVDDIMEYQVTNQQLLIKPLKVEVITTKSGLVLAGISGPDGDGGAIDVNKTRDNMLQRAIVISCGKGVSDEYKPGMTVMYYKTSFCQMIRCGDDVYHGIEEYNIKGYLKQK